MYKIMSSPKGGLLYIPSFYSKEQSNYLFDYFKIFQNPDKIQQKIKGKLFPIPRKILYYGEKDYSYSNITHKATGVLPKEFLHILKDVNKNTYIIKLLKKENIENINSCLINYYDNENNSLNWHSDDEQELGPSDNNKIIISLSLGDSRDFNIRSKDENLYSRITLNSGDLVIMYGNFQEMFEHSIPKSKTFKKLRINLTYRIIK